MPGHAGTELCAAGTIERHSRAAWGRHGVTTDDPAALRSRLAAGNLVAAARATARRHGDREAIRVGADALTHRELDRLSRHLASVMRGCGAGIGARVLIAGPNSCDLVIAYLAALRAGASVTFAGPTVTAVELDALLDAVSPVLVAGSGEAEEVVTARAIPWLHLGTARTSSATGPPGRDAPVRSTHLAHLAFTSGTTGAPKATPLTHGNVLASVRAVIDAWRWSADDVLVHGLPLQHAHGLTALHLTMITGSRSVVLPAFDPDDLCRAVVDHRATVMFGVPATHEALLASERLRRTDTSSLRLVVSGSAPLAPRTSDALTDAFEARPLERYGLTESGFVLSNPYSGERVAGSVGFPLPGIEVDVVGPDGGPLEDGQDGEIVVRGPQVFGGYIADPAAQDTFLPAGWFRTGDVGRRDPLTGRFAITGRLKELIITGGMNVYPREIELAIEAHAGVRAAAVVGLPSDRWGEEVTAFVEADADLDTDALMISLRDRLAGHKRPKRCVVVDRLPRNHLGKIVRSALG